MSKDLLSLPPTSGQLRPASQGPSGFETVYIVGGRWRSPGSGTHHGPPRVPLYVHGARHQVLPRSDYAHPSLLVESLDLGAKVWTPAELWQCVLGQPPRPVHPLLAPWIPYVLLAIYIFGKPLLDRACGALGTTGKSTPFKMVALVHNLALCAYSAATAWYTWRITFSQFSRLGVLEGYCEGGGGWEAGLGKLGFLFYLSKYWELADTALLVVKRRQPSYLQVYHHAGTAYGAWLLCLTHVPVMFIFVGLNAVVHTIMYFYYAATVCGYRFPGKAGITSMQIGQFYFGILICMPAFFVRRGTCTTSAQKVALSFMIAHAIYLTKLFGDFFRASYQQKRLAAKKVL